MAPLAIDGNEGAFTKVAATLMPVKSSGKSSTPIAPGATINKDGSAAGGWCELSVEAKDNLACPVVRIDGLGLQALNGHYIKEHSKMIQGRSIYIHESDLFFAYWCDKYSEW